jgi:hypothetical protein
MEYYDISYYVFTFCDYRTLLKCMRVDKNWHSVICKIFEGSTIGNFTKTHKKLKLFPKTLKIRGSIVDYYLLKIGLLIAISFCHDSTDGLDCLCINLIDCFGEIHEQLFECPFENKQFLTATFSENFRESHFFIKVYSKHESINFAIDLNTFTCCMIYPKNTRTRILNKTNLITYNEPDQEVKFVYPGGFKYPSICCSKETNSKNLQISLNFETMEFENYDIIYDKQQIIYRYTILGLTRFVTIEKNDDQIFVTNYKNFCYQEDTDFYMIYCKFTKMIRLLRIQNISHKQNIQFKFFDRW